MKRLSLAQAGRMDSLLLNTQCVISAPRGISSRRDLVEKRLLRFDRRYREQVCRLAERHERLADLALSFPALLFVLALKTSRFDSDPAVAGVLRGEKLADLARQAGIPLWLRKFSPEALSEPIEALPDSDDFRRRIGNFVPRSPKLGRVWLRAVGEAYALAHEPFALWIAREVARNSQLVTLERLRLIALWAWFSVKMPTEITAALAETWHDSTSFAKAAMLADAWREAVELHLSLGEEPLQDMWLTPANMAGFDFVPLKCKNDILGEAAAMRNCLRTYGGRLARNRCRLWSIRKDGARVATLEVSCRQPDPCPRIVQIRTPDGDHAPAEIWWVAHAWIRSHNLADIETTPMSSQESLIDRNRWVSLWRPYWLEKKRIPDWLPLSPSLRALHDL